MNFKSGSFLSIGSRYYFQDLIVDFELIDDLVIPIDSYSYISCIKGMYLMTGSRLFRFNSAFSAGTFYDGYRWSGEIEPYWSVNPTLILSGFYQINRLQFPERNNAFTAHLVRFRLEYNFNTELSASAFVQFNNENESVSSNFRLRYNPREGNDLYVVYNEALNIDRFSSIPELPLSNHRTILIKYTYTFNY